MAIDKKFGAPTVTHDGVTVAKEIELKDPFENMFRLTALLVAYFSAVALLAIVKLMWTGGLRSH